MDHHLAQDLRVCRLFYLEIEFEDHFIFGCSIYYEIKGRYHCLFRDSHGSLSTFFHYPNQHCLSLYLRETFLLRKPLMSSTQYPTGDCCITSFFLAFAPEEECRRQGADPPLSTHRTRRQLQDPPTPLRTRQITLYFLSRSTTTQMVFSD